MAKRLKLAAGLVFLGLVVVVLSFRLFVTDSSPELTHHTKPDSCGSAEAGRASVLIVALHAYTRDRDNMADIRRAACAVHEDADVLMPNYNTSVFSNASMLHTALQLDESLQDIVERHPGSYQRIVLVGHSVGALLARKTYLYGKGRSSDYPLGAARDRPKEWVERVDRIVLLAGMNRGWSAESLPPINQVVAWFGRLIHKITGQGRMIMSIERGSPFVANLKMEWIRMVSRPNSDVAQVIQLLGDDDQMAPEEDHKELMAAPNFVFIPVPGTKHGNVVDLYADGDSTDGDSAARQAEEEVRRNRLSRFTSALEQPIEALHERYGSNRDYLDRSAGPERQKVRHVVFVVHGIRDYGEWVDDYRRELKRADPSVAVITSKYGYFPMMRFLLFSDRQENVRWFVDEYTEALALYPNAERFSFIGHSNGTYVLASALEKYAAIKFDRVYFAGSVVPTDFGWTALVHKGRVGEIRNDIATGDWVVALFPKMFQLIRREFKIENSEFFDLGSAGFDGFESKDANRNQAALSGAHSAAIASKTNRDTIVSYILEGGVAAAGGAQPNATLAFLSNVAWLVWIVLVLVIAGIGYGVWRLGKRAAKPRPGLYLSIYGLVVLVTLHTV